jgi:hypothetical protein
VRAVANTGEEHRFSWKRAALHCAVPLVLVVIAAAVIVVVLDPDDPGKLGEETGRLMLPAMLLALLTSYLIQTRRKLYAWVFGTLAVVGVAGAVATPVLQRMRVRPMPLAEAERGKFEVVDVGGVAHLRHARLGFSFLAPVGLPRNAEAEAALRRALPEDDSTFVYAFADTVPGPVLLVILRKANHIDRDTLAALISDLSKLSDTGAVREVQNRIIWEPSFHGAEVHYMIDETNHFRVGAWVDSFGVPDAELIVAIVAISLGDDRFAGVFPSFRYQ